MNSGTGVVVDLDDLQLEDKVTKRDEKWFVDNYYRLRPRQERTTRDNEYSPEYLTGLSSLMGQATVDLASKLLSVACKRAVQRSRSAT